MSLLQMDTSTAACATHKAETPCDELGKNTAKQWQNDDKDFLIQRSPKQVASYFVAKKGNHILLRNMFRFYGIIISFKKKS